jgi:hypothetical protein
MRMTRYSMLGSSPGRGYINRQASNMPATPIEMTTQIA